MNTSNLPKTAIAKLSILLLTTSLLTIALPTLGRTEIVDYAPLQPQRLEQPLAQFLPRPPDTGTPTGRPVPGTTRPEAACPATAKPLMAIVANNGEDFTLSAHPTFWFYIPYRAEQLKTIEFMLLNRNERETIYQTSIKLTDKPGLIKVTLPNDSQSALAENQTYRWRLNLDCQPDRTLEPDLAIDGWVRRLPMNSQLEAQLETQLEAQLEAQLRTTTEVTRIYQDNHIWMDAIAHAADQHFANPTDVANYHSWRQILQTLNLSEIAEEPLTNTELISVAE
jgi:hypothetical protein